MCGQKPVPMPAEEHAHRARGGGHILMDFCQSTPYLLMLYHHAQQPQHGACHTGTHRSPPVAALVIILIPSRSADERWVVDSKSLAKHKLEEGGWLGRRSPLARTYVCSSSILNFFRQRSQIDTVTCKYLNAPVYTPQNICGTLRYSNRTSCHQPHRPQS